MIQPPIPALQPYVESVWANDPSSAHVPSGREHVLPCGQMHLAVRLDGVAVRLYADADDAQGEIIGDAVVAGARAGYYIKDVSMPARSVGVQLRPGATAAMFDTSAAALQGRHVSLDALWGADAARLRERLQDAHDVSAQLDVLQSMLLSRLRVIRALHPTVAEALSRMETATNISHRRRDKHQPPEFHRPVPRGTQPVTEALSAGLHFRKLLRTFAAKPARLWIDLALAAGYYDHCSNSGGSAC